MQSYHISNQCFQLSILTKNITVQILVMRKDQQMHHLPQQPSSILQQQQASEPAFQLPQANPIQKRQKLKPYSIFALHTLPKFNFKSEISQPTFINQTVNLTNEKFILPSTQLKQLFNDPIYVYNNRALMKNNSDFGCIRVQFSESGLYRMKSNVESLQEYELVNGIRKFDQIKQRREEQSMENSDQFDNFKPNETSQMKEQNNQQQIYFESRFQSGNLCFAAASPNKDESTYYLILSRDMNTSKCTQWFFFKTINKLVGKVTFHILNFVKKYSVFESGMKICMASKSNGYKWIRGGTEIKYRETNIPITTKKSDRFYYALSFCHHYTTPQDNVYFAYCYPYTYSMMEDFLFHHTETSSYMKRRNIAITPGGNSVDLITISNFKQKQYKKRIVFITSRVHPGETPSSFICQGMMRYLLGESEEAQSLRQNFIFKFVPMLNPDGVINGSYRCSLSGYDLNRVWHRADKISHPEIYGTRKAIFQTSEIQKIFFFADLHAHSKKKGVFVYGCQDKNNPYICRQIPFLFWKNVRDFNYYQCNFMMRTGRQGTSRLYIYQQLDIDYSYTIQHSFCGPSKDKVHYTPRDYMKIGVDYLVTFFKYFCRNKKMFNGPNQQQIFDELYKNKQLIKVGEAEELSSSDEQLDKQKAPLGVIQHKQQRKTLTKKQSLRMSEGAISSAKRTVSNFRKTNINILENKSKQYFAARPVKQIAQFNETMRPLPVVGPNFRQKRSDKDEQLAPYISFRPRVCSSSLTNHARQDNDKKYMMRQTFRYEQQQDVNSLTNLFLPSLTRVSYKKYSRKSSSPRNMVQIGSNMLQNAMILKDQIKASQKKKPNWKEQARSYL